MANFNYDVVIIGSTYTADVLPSFVGLLLLQVSRNLEPTCERPAVARALRTRTPRLAEQV